MWILKTTWDGPWITFFEVPLKECATPRDCAILLHWHTNLEHPTTFHEFHYSLPLTITSPTECSTGLTKHPKPQSKCIVFYWLNVLVLQNLPSWRFFISSIIRTAAQLDSLGVGGKQKLVFWKRWTHWTTQISGACYSKIKGYKDTFKVCSSLPTGS